MLNLGGLSAAYPGYQASENLQATTETNQAAAKEAALKLLGQHVLGRALTGAQPDQGPQPPAPGQPSAPSAPQGGGPAGPGAIPNPMQQAPPAPPQGGPPGQAPGPGVSSAPTAPAGGTGMPEITLQGLTQRILATSPRVREHPEVLLAALERAAPLLDRQSKDDLYELRKQFQTQQLETRERMVRMQQEGLNQRNAASTDARIYGSDTSADARRYAADKGLEGRKYSADTILQARELSTDARRDIATLSAETRKEIAERAEVGRTDRAQLSATARKEIATLNSDTRREVTGMMEAGRDRRADQTSEDRRYGVDARSDTAAAAEEGRNTRSAASEEGKRERSILSAETKQAMQRMSQAARQEIEDARQGGADRRAGLSAETRKEIAGMGIDARKEITGYLESGRNDRAGARNDLTARRMDQGDQREARLAAQGQLRADQGYQRLELQKQDLQRKLEAGAFQQGSTEQKAALAQQRATINAQHEYAYKFVQSNSAMSNMKKDDKKAFLDAAAKERDDSIAALRRASLGKLAASAIAPAPSDAPPASMLKEGQPQAFKNKQTGEIQTWTLENGQPKQVK